MNIMYSVSCSQILRHCESHSSSRSGFERETIDYFNSIPYLGLSDRSGYAGCSLLLRASHNVRGKSQYSHLQPLSRGIR